MARPRGPFLRGLRATFPANSNAVWGLRSADRYLFLQVDGSENLVRYFNKGYPFQGGLLDLAWVGVFLMPAYLSAPKFNKAGKMGGGFLSLNPKASPDLGWVAGQPGFPAVLLSWRSWPSRGTDGIKKFIWKKPGTVPWSVWRPFQGH